MTEVLPQLGMLVISKMGRDKGKTFVVVSIVNEDFVLVADGKFRKLADPKLKRWRHLRPLDTILTTIKQKLETNAKIFDSELASCLKEYFLD